MSFSLDFSGLHPALKPYAEYAMQIAEFNGIVPSVTSVLRSWATQERLYRNYLFCLANDLTGLQLPGHDCRFPANPPGESAHQARRVAGEQGALAWDSVVSAEQMPVWIAIRKYVGFRVPENDPVHAELPNWMTYLS